MKVFHSPTARFSEVVEKAGAPEQITLWEDPTKDPVFQKAIRQNRVMTIRQARVGTKKDFGMVGYKPGDHSAFLFFPRPLEPFAEKRIVGIRYDLLAGSKPKGRTIVRSLQRQKTNARQRGNGTGPYRLQKMKV